MYSIATALKIQIMMSSIRYNTPTMMARHVPEVALRVLFLTWFVQDSIATNNMTGSAQANCSVEIDNT